MSFVRLALIGALFLMIGVTLGQAQAPTSGGPVDPVLIDDLVTANRILADQGVLCATRARARRVAPGTAGRQRH